MITIGETKKKQEDGKAELKNFPVVLKANTDY